MRTIKTPPGAGDNIWLISKLLSTGERFNFQLPDSSPQRGKQIFDMLPSISASCTYVPGLSYRIIEMQNIQRGGRSWRNIKGYDCFSLSCNGHLEAGNRIETFLPDLEMHYRIDWNTAEFSSKAEEILQKFSLKTEKTHFIGIYTSSYAGSKNWGTWGSEIWCEFVRMMHRKNNQFVFVIIGASFDVDMSNDLMNRLRLLRIPFINTIGEPLAIVTEILKRLAYFVGFPSGLSILNETLGKKTFMFYSQAIKAIIETWAEPCRIESGDYKGCLFCPPKQAIDWIFDYYKLNDKI
jgi:hypothetical protein